MKETVLCYLIRQGPSGPEVCLAVKKKKYVGGRLNAAGGHINPGEDAKESAARELFEEQRVVVSKENLKYSALIFFAFPGKEHEDLKCHVFLTDTWEGEPTESNEMGCPQWFPVAELPIDRLPETDAYWLAQVLAGEFLEATFAVDKNYRLLSL